MRPPYQLCLILGCNELAEDHHEPPRSLMYKEDWDRACYKRPLCRFHHELRHQLGYKVFKERYPEYTGVSPEEYRRERRERI